MMSQTAPGAPRMWGMLQDRTRSEPQVFEQRYLAFLQSIERGDADGVRSFLEREFEPDRGLEEYGLTPVMWAVLHGQPDVLRCLLEAGADIHRTNALGQNALIFALYMAHAARDAIWDEEMHPRIRAVLDILRDAGLDVNAHDRNHRSALFIAILRGFRDIVRYLIDWGADLNDRDVYGMTPLMCAAVIGETEIVRLLLEAGADPNVVHWSGETALSLARKKNFRRIVELLEQYGARATHPG